MAHRNARDGGDWIKENNPLFVVGLTYSDDLHAGILEPVCRSNGVILRFPIGQQDQEKWCVRPRACLGPHVLLHDMQQRLAWEMDVQLHADRHTLHVLYCVCMYMFISS